MCVKEGLLKIKLLYRVMAKALMIQGTASGVGKTILTLALCRIFKQDGHRVAPFKAQNMTINTCRADNGEEIAVSQWLQALAAEIEPSCDMNPIILKPAHDGTEVIIAGKPYGTINIENFKQIKMRLSNVIKESYSRLSCKHDIIVIEGAGSPVELNLNRDDIVNMGMAKMANVPVLLVSDIDRGGVFASLFGTIKLMDESERAFVKATIVNRFRGDTTSFNDGVKILEDITKLPVAGVIPYTQIDLPEEDDMFVARHTLDESIDFSQQFDQIAESVRKAVDLKLIYEILEKGAGQ